MDSTHNDCKSPAECTLRSKLHGYCRLTATDSSTSLTNAFGVESASIQHDTPRSQTQLSNAGSDTISLLLSFTHRASPNGLQNKI